VCLLGADEARVSFDHIESKLTRLQKKYDLLAGELMRDYGVDNIFAHMDGQCFELHVKQYVYEVCPYSKAAQKENGSGTSLGSWDSLATTPEGQTLLKFTGGQTCWQGPARSLTVKLHCGAENKLLNVEEPSKCVYEMNMESPAVCDAKHADALRLNLEAGVGAGDSEEEEM